jgi:hypothetical protein
LAAAPAGLNLEKVERGTPDHRAADPEVPYNLSDVTTFVRQYTAAELRAAAEYARELEEAERPDRDNRPGRDEDPPSSQNRFNR